MEHDIHLDEYHHPWVDQSLYSPHGKSLIVYHLPICHKYEATLTVICQYATNTKLCQKLYFEFATNNTESCQLEIETLLYLSFKMMYMQQTDKDYWETYFLHVVLRKFYVYPKYVSMLCFENSIMRWIIDKYCYTHINLVVSIGWVMIKWESYVALQK